MIQELFKFIKIKFHFMSLVLSSLKGSGQAKRKLTQIYLDALYEQSKLPKEFPPQTLQPIHLAGLRIEDLHAHMPDRSTLLTHEELISLLALLVKKNPKKILEIGTFRGGSAYHFLLNSSAQSEIYSLDRTFEHMNPFFLQELKASGRYHQLKMSTAELNESRYQSEFDFIFIDGSHEYTDVKSDSLKALAMLRQGGVLVWDDYSPGCPGVYKCLNELKAQGHDLKNIYGTSLVYLQA